MQVETGEKLGAGRSHIIERPRLTRLLDETAARIILLVAPAGYGKTTLAREWLSGKPHAWYRGNSATADVAALALGLARAAATLVPHAGRRLETRLRVSDAPPTQSEPLAELLAEDLLDWPEDTWLVFDDYHFACDSEPAERFVEHFVSSSSIRLLISSRARPRWATARRLLYGELFEIGRNLLAMNNDEAQSVLTDLTHEESKGLLSLADGWPALLGLAALARQSEPPRESLPDELHDFFAEEIYHAVPARLQEDLRRLALAPTITRDIAESLIGQAANNVLGIALELGFLLTAPRGRFEFHPLLRSFLASKFVEHRDDPDGRLVSGLVRKLIEQKEWDEAFEMIERFFDAGLLIELFEAALPRIVDEARLPTLARWIEAATRNHVDSGVIDFAEAELSLKQGLLPEAEAFGVQAARQLKPNHPFASKALWLAGTSAHLSSREQAALEHFTESGRMARCDVDRRQSLWGRFSTLTKLDALESAKALLVELQDCSGHSADEQLRLGTGRLMLAGITADGARMLESADLLAPLVSRARDPLIRSSFLNVYAASLALSGRYAEALVAAEHEIEVARTYGLEFVIPHARFHLATGLWGLRDFRGCGAILRSLEKTLRPNDQFHRMNIGALRARAHLATGSVGEALDVFERLSHGRSTRPMEAEYLAWWSLAHVIAGDSRRATALADRAESMSSHLQVVALIPWTRVAVSLHRGQLSNAELAEAYAFAVKSGNIDAFVAAYRVRPLLIRLLAEDPQRHDGLKTILERARDHTLAQQVGLRLPPPSDKERLGNLTKREREVIDLICQGLTNKEIGRTLFITEGTVKVHVRKICQKLGVRSRTEAAMRAAELSD